MNRVRTSVLFISFLQVMPARGEVVETFSRLGSQVTQSRFVQKVQEIGGQALESVGSSMVHFAEYDDRRVTELAEQVKVKIRNEVHRETKVFESSPVGTPEWEWAQARLAKRQDATACQNIQLGEILRGALEENCHVEDVIRVCEQAETKLNNLTQLVGRKLNEVQSHPKPLVETVKSAQAEIMVLAEKSRQMTPPCYQQLKSLGESVCRDTISRVLDQAMQENIQNLCSDEVIDHQVKSFVSFMRDQKFSSRLRQAQVHYINARRSQIAIAKYLHTLTEWGQTLIAGPPPARPQTSQPGEPGM